MPKLKLEERTGVKVACCNLCGGMIGVANMPFAETDRETQRDFKKYAEKGYTLKYLNNEEYRTTTVPFNHTDDCKRRTG